MPQTDDWRGLEAELARWRAEGKAARLWLRDDDAVDPTPALDRLLRMSNDFGVPLLLSVIPAGATPALARAIAGLPHVLPAQHGFAHRNHATFEKAMELGPQRPPEVVLTELRAGRERLLELFAGRLPPALVPPWNRIAKDLLARLPELGFDSLSGFGWEDLGPAPGVREINCHVDIIDWRGTRGGYPQGKLVNDLLVSLRQARSRGGGAIGILAHHLVHDETAWSFLGELLARTTQRADLRWVGFEELRRDGPAGAD